MKTSYLRRLEALEAVIGRKPTRPRKKKGFVRKIAAEMEAWLDEGVREDREMGGSVHALSRRLEQVLDEQIRRQEEAKVEPETPYRD